MKPHKHAELIKAWADGAVIETKNKHSFVGWFEDDEPWWNDDDYEFRIKPEQNTDDEDIVEWVELSTFGYFVVSPESKKANLKVVFDKTGRKLKSAEVLK